MVNLRRDGPRIGRIISRTHLVHAFLLRGKAGIGKSSWAQFAVASLLCERGQELPCERCGSCLQVARGSHPDVLYLDEEKYLIASADRILEHLKLHPMGRYRVAVLIDAENLNTEAANRLLKTIEEPPGSGKIVLTTSRPYLVVDTIRSRCTQIAIQPPTVEESAPLGGNSPDFCEELAKWGYSPGAALRSTGEENLDFLNDLISWMDGPSADPDQLQRLMGYAVSPEEIVSAVEMAVHRTLKANPRHHPLEWIWQRRSRLHRIRKAVDAGIALNKQMLFEQMNPKMGAYD